MLDSKKTADAIASVQGVADYIHSVANFIAGGLGMTLSELSAPTNLAEAAGNLEGSMNALIHVGNTFLATAAVVPVLLEKAAPVVLKVEQKPSEEAEVSESLTAGAGGIMHGRRIGEEIAASLNGHGVLKEEPAQKGRKRKG
jgi:hypothetical protein